MEQPHAQLGISGANESRIQIGGTPGRRPGALPVASGRAADGSPLWVPHKPGAAPTFTQWLWPIEFNYAPLPRGRAAVGLLASVEEQSEPPRHTTLVVRRRGGRSEHSACAERIEERVKNGLLWLATFELPLEVVRAPRVWFTLRALGRLPVPLQAPLLNLRVLEEVEGVADRAVDRRARRYLAAIGAGVAVAAASGTAASSAAADAAPVAKATTPVVKPAEAPAHATKRTTKPATKPKTKPTKPKTATPAPPAPHTSTKSKQSAPRAAQPHTKHTSTLGTAIKITRPDSAEICQHILLLAPAKRKAALERAQQMGVTNCDITTDSNPTNKKHKQRPGHKHHSHHKPQAWHHGQRATSAPGAHAPGAQRPPHAPKSAPRVHHPSGGAALSAPATIKPRPTIKPHVIVPPAPAPTVTTPPTVPAPPSATSIWSGGFSINPFSATQLKRFSNLVAQLDQPPRFLIPIYKAAGRRFHVQWEILAAINAIETNYGRDLAVSPAGAMGWMQFMPGTWAAWGMAADGRHRPNPYDPRDAIFSAARYLAANGAPKHIRRALFAYNHAQWYVDAVLWRAQLITDQALGKHARRSGYALPLDIRYMNQLGRTDDGVDVEDAPDGAAVYSITPGIVTAVASDPAGFGPDYPVILVTKGPLAGQYIYYGHVAASLVHPGQRVMAGQPIAVMGHTGDAASLGHGHIEIGFSDGSGDPLNHHGPVAWTPSGEAMRNVLTTLAKAFKSLNARPAAAGHNRPSPFQQPVNVLFRQPNRWISADEQGWT